MHDDDDGVAGTGSELTIRVMVTLENAGNDSELLRTGLTLPIGQTVIPGSAKPTMGARGALILVVQPEVTDRLDVRHAEILAIHDNKRR